MIQIQDNVMTVTKKYIPEIHDPYKPENKPHRFYRRSKIDVAYIREVRNPYVEKLMLM